MAAVTASPYDQPLSGLRENTENLGTWLTAEVRQADDATAARADALLARMREDRER